MKISRCQVGRGQAAQGTARQTAAHTGRGGQACDTSSSSSCSAPGPQLMLPPAFLTQSNQAQQLQQPRTCSVATSSSDRRSCARSSRTADSSSRARSCAVSAAAAWAPSSSSSLSRTLRECLGACKVWGGRCRRSQNVLYAVCCRAQVGVPLQAAPVEPAVPCRTPAAPHLRAPCREASTSATNASRSAAAAASCLRREAASPSAPSRRS